MDRECRGCFNNGIYTLLGYSLAVEILKAKCYTGYNTTE